MSKKHIKFISALTIYLCFILASSSYATFQGLDSVTSSDKSSSGLTVDEAKNMLNLNKQENSTQDSTSTGNDFGLSLEVPSTNTSTQTSSGTESSSSSSLMDYDYSQIDNWLKNNDIGTIEDTEVLNAWLEEVRDMLDGILSGTFGWSDTTYDRADDIEDLIDDRLKVITGNDKVNGTGETDDELLSEKYDAEAIAMWLVKNDANDLSETVKEEWITRINDAWDNGTYDARSCRDALARLEGKSETEIKNEYYGGTSSPGESTGILGNSSASGNHTVDEAINEAEDFINKGNQHESKIDGTNLQTASDTLYNILLSIGIVVAVAVGMYLGVKFMLSSAEDKAKVKESLIPYIAGCVVIFGAFVIWKLAILLLGGLA